MLIQILRFLISTENLSVAYLHEQNCISKRHIIIKVHRMYGLES